jgi:AcrR family transcriptional regulator
MSRHRSAGFEVQRDAILAAAADLFAERGYPSASVSDLAAALGVSKALLYHYYRDKEQLLADIVDRYLDSLVALVAEVAARPLQGEALLQALIENLMRVYEHSAAYHRVLVQDLKYLSSTHRRRAQLKQRRVVETFAAAVGALAPELESRQLLKPVTMLLFGMMNWTFTWLHGRGRLSYATLAPMISGMFLRGVTALALPPATSAQRPRRVAQKAAPNPRAGAAAASGRRRPVVRTRVVPSELT